MTVESRSPDRISLPILLKRQLKEAKVMKPSYACFLSLFLFCSVGLCNCDLILSFCSAKFLMHEKINIHQL